MSTIFFFIAIISVLLLGVYLLVALIKKMTLNQDNTIIFNEEVKTVGFPIRMLAFVLDSVIISPLHLFSNIFSNGTLILFLFLSMLIYFVVIPLFWSGFTPGKRIVGIRIMEVKGEKLTFNNMFMREIIGMSIYILTLGLGVIVSLIMVFRRKDKRTIHDLIGSTCVTYKTETNNEKPLLYITTAFLSIMILSSLTFYNNVGYEMFTNILIGLYIIISGFYVSEVKNIREFRFLIWLIGLLVIFLGDFLL